MKRFIVKVCVLMAAVMFLSITVMELNAHARAGGSRSSGSSGSRSYSRPASPYSQPRQQQQAAPAPSPFQQQAGGGFMRSMAGGIMGGMLGSMLFSSFAGAGAGMGGGAGGGMGGGIGIFEIILLAGIGYLIYRLIKKRRADNSTLSLAQEGYSMQGTPATVYQVYETPANEVATGLSHVQQMDSSFDENRFNDLVMDIFFKIQGAWMNRNLAPVSGLLTNEMTRVFQEDLDRMLKDKQINRLENIAVRKVEISEVWQESGHDYITASIYANLLDYTTDDTTGAVVAGSKTEPVKFEEYWTFSRSVGNNPWQLSAISQK